MNGPEKEQICSLLNALQLCISTPIKNIQCNKNEMTVFLKDLRTMDMGLLRFKKLVHITKETHQLIQFKILESHELETLVSFLMLSRLQVDNMARLIQMDSRFVHYGHKLGLIDQQMNSIESIQKAADLFFKAIKEKKMTIRELAEKTGLTAMTINNLKSGKNIQLSSFLKLARALDLKIMLSN